MKTFISRIHHTMQHWVYLSIVSFIIPYLPDSSILTLCCEHSIFHFTAFHFIASLETEIWLMFDILRLYYHVTISWAHVSDTAFSNISVNVVPSYIHRALVYFTQCFFTCLMSHCICTLDTKNHDTKWFTHFSTLSHVIYKFCHVIYTVIFRGRK